MRFEYVGTTANRQVGLDGPDNGLWAETFEGARGRKWSYTLGQHSISGASRNARECSMTVKAENMESLDVLRRVCDADVAMCTPGLLKVDDWSMRAYVVEAEPSKVTPTHVEQKLTVVMLDGVWRRAITTPFRVIGDGDYADLDWPHDYGHDWTGVVASKVIQNPGWTRLPVKLTIYGAAVNPAIMIGENIYEFDVTVPSGGLLVCDGISKTVTLTDANGDGATNNAFAAAHRGDGIDSGEYCFQPLAAGQSTVAWDSGFGFDLTIYEEE